jgi:hypothetical protein
MLMRTAELPNGQGPASHGRGRAGRVVKSCCTEWYTARGRNPWLVHPGHVFACAGPQPLAISVPFSHHCPAILPHPTAHYGAPRRRHRPFSLPGSQPLLQPRGSAPARWAVSEPYSSRHGREHGHCKGGHEATARPLGLHLERGHPPLHASSSRGEARSWGAASEAPLFFSSLLCSALLCSDLHHPELHPPTHTLLELVISVPGRCLDGLSGGCQGPLSGCLGTDEGQGVGVPSAPPAGVEVAISVGGSRGLVHLNRLDRVVILVPG